MEDNQTLAKFGKFAESWKHFVKNPARQCQTCGFSRILKVNNEFKFIGPEAPMRLDSPFFIIGQNPGQSELKLGRPFVGRSGKLLDRLLQESNISRDECYITNACKCKVLTSYAMDTMAYDSRQQILGGAAVGCSARHLVPELQMWCKHRLSYNAKGAILVLGRIAARALKIPLGHRNIKSVRCIPIKDSRFEFPILREVHPSYLLRTKWDDYPKVLRSFHKLRSLVIDSA